MRILLTNNHLQRPGGTERWTEAMAGALQDRGHEVDIFTFIVGPMAAEMQAKGLSVITDTPTGAYDLGLFNHGTCWARLTQMDNCRPAVSMATVHGPSHPLERPLPGADRYIAVSQEIAAMYAMRVRMPVIRNGIDLDEFIPAPMQASPRVLSLCKNATAGAMIAEACQRQGVPFTGVHYIENPSWDVAAMIRDADIVFACGRSAYEALACNRHVVVFDQRDESKGPQADGVLEPSNIEEIAQYNCSTRARGLSWTVNDLEAAIHAYRPKQWGRPWAEQNANLTRQVDSYLALYDEVIHERTVANAA